MTDSLEARVAALEAKVGDKSLDERFREQVELIDRLFVHHLDEMDRRWDAKLQERDRTWDAKLDERDRRWDAKLEEQFEAKLSPIQRDLAALRDAVTMILSRLP